MDKYDIVSDRDVILKDNFLPLSYFQQWVLFDLYISRKYENRETKSADYLKMESCMSVVVDGFDEDVANDNLEDLSGKGLIEQFENGEWGITFRGSILVKGATGKIHELLENSDFDAIMDRITGKTVKENLRHLRDDEDYADTEHVVKKIMRLFRAHIKEWVEMVALLIRDLVSS